MGNEGIFSIGLIINLAIIVLFFVSLWKIFTTAGRPGWACIIPIYNAYIILQIAGKPAWWLILFLIPFVNIIIAIIASIALAKKFGKGAGFGLGLTFFSFIFYPILAFSDAQYQG